MIKRFRRAIHVELPDWEKAAANPFFRWRAASLRISGTAARMRLLFFAWMITSAFLISLYMVFTYFSAGALPQTRVSSAALERATLSLLNTASNGFRLAFVAGCIADLYVLVITIVTVSFTHKDTTWEIIQLTGVSMKKILDAEAQTAELRAWRVVVPEMALHAALVLLVMGAATIRTLYSARMGAPFFAVMQAFSILVAGIAYTLEPYWRLPLITSLGLEIAARTQNTINIAGSCVRALIISRFLQFCSLLIVLLTSVGLLIVPANMLSFFVPPYTSNSDLVGIIYLVIVGLTSLVIFKTLYQSEVYAARERAEQALKRPLERAAEE